MTCADVENLIHPLLDGELLPEDRVPVERHVEGCARCRDLVAHEAAFKEHLRTRLRVPAALDAQVRAALDRADLAGDGPGSKMLRRAAPFGLALAAATLV